MERNRQNENVAALEAILFLYGEPMEKTKLSKTLKVSLEELEGIVQKLTDNLASEERGIMIMKKGDSYALVTKPRFSSLLEMFIKESLKEELTPAALETLSLVAYFGPIPRAQIDYVRGVNSSFILRSLLIRGLVERKLKGNFYLYEPSFDLMKYLGIAKKEDLPEFEKFLEIKNTYFSQEKSSIVQEPVLSSETSADQHE